MLICDNPAQTVTVVYDQTAEVHFENKLKMWRVAVTKVDAEANVRRSSDVTLEGAQYGVYKDGALRDSYNTDKDGQIITVTRENIYCVGSITVHKVDTQGTALAGTTYLLEYSEDGTT